jgi:uncharacterized membrane protein (DUF2068 family)
MKLASGCALAAAGFGIFRLLNKDLGTALDHFVTRLHLDSENRMIHEVIRRISGIDHKHLKLIGVGTFFYALLHLVEGTGLVLRKRWAEFLTVIATGSLLPLEAYEIVVKVRPVKIMVLLVNLGIVIYLIVKLLQQHRERAARRAE